MKVIPGKGRPLILGFLLLGVALMASQFFFRIDMTDDKIYTLSPGTLKIVEKLEDEVTAKLYVSKSFDNLPPNFKTHSRRVEEVLREYASHSKGRLKVEVIDPRPDSDDEVWANKYGVRGFASPNGDNAYLGVVFVAGEKEFAIPFLDPRKEDLLEFDISEALIKLQRNHQVKLGIYSPTYIGTTESQGMDDQGRRTERAFLSRLKEFYQVEVFQNPPTDIAADIKVFLLYHPKEADEKLQYALDQYVLRGGHLIAIVDAFSRSELDGKQTPDNPLPELPKLSSQLPTLFSHWGLTFHDDQIVGDPTRSTRIDMGSYTFDYPFFLSLQEGDFSSSHMITASLKQMLLAEAGWFEFKPTSDKLNFEPLVMTSDKAGVVTAASDGMRDPQGLVQQMSGERKVRHLAGLLRGSFSSAYAAPPAGSESQLPYQKAATGEGSVLVVGDMDFMQESQALEAFDYQGRQAQRPKNDNITFLTNAMAYMGGADELISIRSSGRVQRPFKRVKELELQARERWKTEEDKFATQLRALQQKLSQLKVPPGADGEAAALSADQEAELKRYKEEELRVRASLREVRKNLRENIETLGHRLVALNLLAVPGLVSAIGFLIFWRREKRSS